MNFDKIDAALAEALGDVEDEESQSLVVFVRTAGDLHEDEHQLLDKLGIDEAAARDKSIFSATLSPRAVDQLSDQPWIRRLSLTQKLKLLD